MRAVILLLIFVVWSTAASAQVATYRIQRGDTLTKIAARTGFKVDALLRANPSIRQADRIATGDVISVPADVFPPLVPVSRETTASGGSAAKAVLTLFGASLALGLMRGRRQKVLSTPTALTTPKPRPAVPGPEMKRSGPSAATEAVERPDSTLLAHQKRLLLHADGTREMVETTIKVTRRLS